MALPLLVNGGAECGPINPLQGLTKRFDSDRGVQQDHFGPGVPSSSRQVFRTQAPMTSSQADLNAEAIRFFSAGGGPQPFSQPNGAPFDMSSLRTSLAPSPSPSALHALPPPSSFLLPQSADPTEAWAGDFMMHDASSSKLKGGQFRNSPVPGSAQVMSQHQQQALMEYHQPSIMARQPIAGPSFMPAFQQQPVLQQHQSANSLFEHAFSHVESSSRWEDQFKSHSAAPTLATQPSPSQTQQQHTPIPVDADEFAKVAGLLLNSISSEENPKFKNSAFLGLMRQVRDREVVVEGNQMEEAGLVSTSGVGATTTTIPSTAAAYKGKGREVPLGFSGSQNVLSHPAPLAFIGPHAPPMPLQFAPTARRKSVHFERGAEETFIGDKEETRAAEQQQDTEADASWDVESEDYKRYWAEADARTEKMVRAGRDASIRADQHQQYTQQSSSLQNQEWDNLQEDWERWEASAVGVRPATRYAFQSKNPYLLGDPATRNHSMHGGQTRSIYDSVLEREAAVQQDMYNAEAWYDLGIKQQENERENKAEEALARAVEIDPNYLPAYLALAISYANDGNRADAYETIRKWVRLNGRYEGVVGGVGVGVQKTQREMHDELVGALLKMAREAPVGEVDADVQIALGVLLNTGEEYEKAKDCFQSALSVRPEDWALYNRVGATLANSGNSASAIEYYNHALALNPSYIRARFNLGISCINLRKFEEAAQHILDALVLQESEARHGSGGGDEDKRGVTSSALWDCLRSTCIYLHRSDLAALTELKDLDRFRRTFYATNPNQAKTDF